MPVEETPPPYWIMGKDAAPTDASQLQPVVENYRQQFLKLWGKGSD